MQNRTKPFTWRCALFLGAIALLIAGLVRHARAEDCLADVDETALRRAIATLSPRSDDVASCLACETHGRQNAPLLCHHPRLKLMAVLNARAAVYARENATKTLTSHDTPDCGFATEQLAALADAEEACRKLRQDTNDHLGGMSPYRRGDQ